MKNFNQRANVPQSSGRRTSTTPATSGLSSRLQRSGGCGDSGRASDDLHELPTQETDNPHESVALLRQQWKKDLEEVMNYVTESIKKNETKHDTKGKTDFDNIIKNEIMKKLENLDKKWMSAILDIEHKLSELLDSNKKLAEELDTQCQYSRRSCILIHGHDESQSENVSEEVVNLMNNSLGLQLSERDLVAAHRLGRNNNTNSNKKPKSHPIIVKFLRMTDRDNVYKNKRKFKGSQIIITKSDKIQKRLVKTASGLKN